MRKLILVFALCCIPSLALGQTYGSDITLGLTPTCDSQYNGTDLACVNVNDGNQATYWGSGTGAFPHWVTFDFTTDKSPAKIAIDLTLVATCSKVFSFSVGPNGSTWYPLILDETPNATAIYEYEFTPSSTPFRYAKFNWTSNWGGCGTEANITELSIYEDITPEATTTMYDATNLGQALLLVLGTLTLSGYLVYKIITG